MSRTRDPNFGAVVAEARRTRGWTQTALGRAAGLERRTISRIETGAAPAPDTFEALVRVLGLEPAVPPPVSGVPQLLAVGRLLRQVRRRHGITLREAAASLDISAGRLSLLERGQAAPRKLFDVGDEGDYELKPNAWRSRFYEPHRDRIADLVSGDGTRRGAFRRM